MKVIFTFCITFFYSVTLLAASFSVVTEPLEAEVYVRKPQSLERIKVGKTPIDMDMDNFLTNYAKGNTFLMIIEKEGYENYQMLVGHANKSGIQLTVNLQLSKDFVITKKFDLITGHLFEAQRLIRQTRYDDALTILEGLEKDYPYISTVYEMKGSALYLKKDFNGALAYYRKAFSKNPTNMDAYSMKEYLEKTLGLEKTQ